MKHYMLLLLGVTVIAISACKKDNNDTTMQPGNYEVYNFFKNHGAPEQTFSVKADEQTIITTAAGAKIQFWPDNFQTVNGTIVTGYVDVKVREIYTKKDMILSNATTTSYGELLGSKGEIFIGVTQNGEELFPRFQYIVQLPTTDTQGSMPLFYGDIINVAADSSTTGATALNWVQDTTSFYVSNYYYTGYPGQFNWLNCDFFYTDPNPKDSVTAVLPDGYDQTNTMVFLSLDGRNITANVYSISPGSHIFKYIYIPVGMNVHVVTISESDGKMYFSKTPLTISTNNRININPQEIAEDQIEVQLNTLP